MTTYYAVCDANGPISRSIEADSREEAVRQFEAANTHEWIDEPATDAEDELGIDGTGMSEDEFAAALETAGCKMVRDLSAIVCGQDATMRNTHIAGGWRLWATK